MPLVDIHDVGDADVGDGRQMLVVILSPPREVQVGWPLLSPRIPMIATLIASFGLFCARVRAGDVAASPTVAAAVFDRNTRRFITAVLLSETAAS